MRKLLLFILLSFFVNIVEAQQVGINTETPNPLTVLDIQTSLNNEGKVIPRGIMIPRLREEQRDQIDVSDLNQVNSLLIYNIDEDCFNYFSKKENKWKSICGNTSGNAVIAEVNCENLAIRGDYKAGTPLNSSNYLELSVNVTKAGSYEISAISNPVNGYFFSSSGNFLAAGIINITVPGFGIPISEQTDSIIVVVNSTSYCGKDVEVQSSEITPVFDVLCNNSPSNVKGEYIVGTPLQFDDNQLLLTINSNQESFGSIYKITTDTVNGCYFSAEGVIVQSQQIVALSGYGTPQVGGTNTFRIMSNTGNGVNVYSGCEMQVKVARRTITIVGVGENNTYYMGATTNGMYRLLNNSSLFAPNQTSTFPVNGFNIIKQGAGNGINLSTIIANNKPDIIIIQYNWIGGAYGASNLQALTDFVNSNGVLILCSDGDGSTAERNVRCKNIIDSIFETTAFTPTGITSEDTQPFAATGDSEAPVLDGPFMNLREKHMARDAGNNFNFTSTDMTNVSVISWNNDSKVSMRAFMHKSKGFMFIGDGAPFSYSSENVAPYNYPMKLDSDYNPAINIWSTPHTYNSYLFCNIMAWAVDYIQKNKP